MKKDSRTAGFALWTLQVVLALLFLFAGGMKLRMPLATLAAMSHFPGGFMRFIGVAEVLGAIGLVLPWALHVQRSLTPIAASGLVIIMIGATLTTVIGMGASAAIVPFVVGVLASTVAVGRWRTLRQVRLQW